MCQADDKNVHLYGEPQRLRVAGDKTRRGIRLRHFYRPSN